MAENKTDNSRTNSVDTGKGTSPDQGSTGAPAGTHKKDIANVLAHRYASPELVNLWSPEHKIIMERRLWIAVLRAQKELGVDVPD